MGLCARVDAGLRRLIYFCVYNTGLLLFWEEKDLLCVVALSAVYCFGGVRLRFPNALSSDSGVLSFTMVLFMWIDIWYNEDGMICTCVSSFIF